MKIKTQTLTGVALDWAVSMALGHGPVLDMNSHGGIWHGWYERTPATPDGRYRRLPGYTYDWSDGGPIIEREGYAIRKYGDFPETRWQADDWQFRFANPKAVGPTPLVAAMRCYVASKLGNEVEIPDALAPQTVG